MPRRWPQTGERRGVLRIFVEITRLEASPVLHIGFFASFKSLGLLQIVAKLMRGDPERKIKKKNTSLQPNKLAILPPLRAYL